MVKQGFFLLFQTSTFIVHVYDILRCNLFCRYVREGSDRTRGDDITKFLAVELDATETRIRKLLQRHPYWCYVPLMTVRDTMDFLLNRGFTRDQILYSIHALLYSRSVIQECLCTICSRPFQGPESLSEVRTETISQVCWHLEDIIQNHILLHDAHPAFYAKFQEEVLVYLDNYGGSVQAV